MNQFKKYNLIVGWATFIFAAIVYLLTIEPTASLWDCSEFIATSDKLEIMHPPGAPLFMMISRLFAIFSPDPAHVGMMINSMSALASAATILFLFWSITHLAVKSYRKKKTNSLRHKLPPSWEPASSELSHTHLPIPSGSQPLKAKSTPFHPCSPPSSSGQSSNGRTWPTSRTPTVG